MSQVRALPPISAGKKRGGNDDFVLNVPILNSLLLGVLGDFTSTSPKGINVTLTTELTHYIESCASTWREHLIPAEDIAALVARFINDWLGRRRDRARTTLVVIVYDAYHSCFHYVCIGDSGIGVIGKNGLRYISKGDTSGVRDASGFLPMDSKTVHVRQENINPGDVVFAYTDGLWENTAHLAEMQQPDAYLTSIFTGNSLKQIDTQIQTGILGRSTGKDDLSILVIKEEQVTDQQGSELSPQRLEAILERKIAQALEQVPAPSGLTPMEETFLKELRAADGGVQKVEQELNAQLKELYQADRAKLEESIQQKIEEQAAAIREMVQTENKKLLALLTESKVTGGPHPTGQGNGASGIPVAKLEKDIENLTAKIEQLEQKAPSQTAKIDLMEFAKDNSKLLLGVFGLILFIILALKFMPSSGEKKSTTQSQNLPVQAATTTGNDCPGPPLSQQEQRYPNVKAPTALLAALGISETQFRQELFILSNGISQAKANIKAATGNTVKINLERPVQARSAFTLRVKYTQPVPWVQAFTAGNAQTAPIQNVYYIWLQIVSMAESNDGLWGDGTKGTLVDHLGQQLSPENAALLSKALTKTDLKPLSYDMQNLIADTFHVGADNYDQQLSGITARLRKEATATSWLSINEVYANEPFQIQAIFCQNGSPTPLSQWHSSGDNKATAPILAVWLAARLGLEQATGDLEPIRQRLALFQKPLNDIVSSMEF